MWVAKEVYCTFVISEVIFPFILYHERGLKYVYGKNWIENRGILHKLRAHEDVITYNYLIYTNSVYWDGLKITGNFLKDLHNIEWCPVQGNAFIRENDIKETFLATSGRDKSIKLWAVNDGKCIVQTKIPGNTGIHRPRSSQDDKRSAWVALHWLNEKYILSSGLSGELILWEVSNLYRLI